MAEQTLEKFDPSKLMDGVKDRIKATFVSLIPEDQWSIMIQKEIDHFFNYRRPDSYGNRTQNLPPFSELCQTLIKEEAGRLIAEYLSTDDFKMQWDNYGQPIVSDAVEKIIIENSGAILANMIGGVSASLLHDFANKMRNGQI